MIKREKHTTGRKPMIQEEPFYEEPIDLDHAFDHLEGLIEELKRYDLTDKVIFHLEEMAYAMRFPAHLLKDFPS